jgi:pyridoxal phosphate enzyme (YggS family)
MAQTNEQTGNHKTDENLIPSYCWGGEIDIDANTVRENLLKIEQNIAPCKPKIIGVTKYYGRNSIIKGYEAGLRDFGESRAVEAIKKIESLPEYIRQNSKFHFIGHLQTNKVDMVVKHFDCIHSVDSLKLAAAISNSAQSNGIEKEILLQVNNANEEQKFGYSKDDLKKDLAGIIKLPNLKIVGLMNMAPFGASEETLRNLFHDVADFKSELEQEFGIKLPELSMGMSDDYKIAVEEGATMIRIGRKLFT